MSSRLLGQSLRGTVRTRYNLTRTWRSFRSHRNHSTSSSSRHGAFYTETLPAMMPIFLLGSAIYLGLRLTEMNLLHERFLEEAEARIKQLEDDVATLEAARRGDDATEEHSTQHTSSSIPEHQPPSKWRVW
ncbi:hypothetical protein DFP72DRAFT_570061 [Ephemerocybe angulata]|uniref:Uncharacterized protein n=1 Tax=Ephemerocybe angulata TaxID=980116 RepID=A0A8H6IC79_9AGAR|nr:hypothetical protein DFP72DRAFT_570061 [Tulosesus angulatus]